MAVDTIHIRLLLVSGNQHDMTVPVSIADPDGQISDTEDTFTTVRFIKEEIYKEWPESWSEEPRVSTPDDLRIVYQGRFLDDSTLLKALFSENIPITLHLIPKPNNERSPSEHSKNKNAACCRCIVI
jgi:hypothetical protein